MEWAYFGKTCDWHMPRKDPLENYQTGCGKLFYDASESGNQITDWATYCPYCSGKIKLPKD